jgi:hypothetical protein
MLTSKSKISELILRRLRKYTDDADFDERELMLSVHQSLGSLIRNRFYESKNTESQEVDGSLYYTVSDNSVLEDGSKYYTSLPSTTISLPFGVEIKRIGTKEGRGYTPVQNGFNDLFDGLASSCLEGRIGFYKEGGRVYFTNMDSSNNPSSVEITMVLPMDNLNEDDEINIPADMVEQVVEVVVAKYTNTLGIPSDDINNSIDQ